MLTGVFGAVILRGGKEMDDHLKNLNIEELTALGLFDPAAPDAADRLELLRYVHTLEQRLSRSLRARASATSPSISACDMGPGSNWARLWPRPDWSGTRPSGC